MIKNIFFISLTFYVLKKSESKKQSSVILHNKMLLLGAVFVDNQCEYLIIQMNQCRFSRSHNRAGSN